MVKRKAVLDRLQTEARRRGLSFEMEELTRHTAIRIDGFASTLGRHSEIAEMTAHAFWDQFLGQFGKGWWR
jgi:hypothetical protein